MHAVPGGGGLARGALVAFLIAVFPGAVLSRAEKKESPQARAARKAAKEAAEAREEQAEQAAREQRRQAHLEHEEIEDFIDHVHDYMKIHEKAEKELGGPPPRDSDPATVLAFNRRLADGIRARRAGARQGDVFTPALRPAFLRLLRSQVLGRDGAAERRILLTEGNPSGDEDDRRRVPLKVNGNYPLGAPLSTVPPTLLEKLPHLPAELRYQFVGRTVLLCDVEANIIVDYLTNAVP